MTECKQLKLELPRVKGRQVKVDFEGGWKQGVSPLRFTFFEGEPASVALRTRHDQKALDACRQMRW